MYQSIFSVVCIALVAILAAIAFFSLYLRPEPYWRRRLSAPLLLASGLIVMFSSAAFADGTTVSVNDAYAAAIPYLCLLATVAIGVLIWFVRTHTKIKLSDSAWQKINDLAVNAAGTFINDAKNRIPAGTTVDVKSPMIAALADKAIDAAPAEFKVLQDKGFTAEHMQEMIVAKIPQVANTSAAAPTP